MCAPLEHNNLASDKILPPTNHNALAMRSSYAAAQCPPIYSRATIGVSSRRKSRRRLCALRAAPNPMSEREHELHRRITSLTERHRAWPRSWARTERAVPRDPFAGGVGSSPHTRGAPWQPRRRRSARGDHPRIRGEHVGAKVGHAAATGIIPAYAGNTDNRIRVLHDYLDHPRIRGEHSALFAAVVADAGIIPAYAGNTFPSDLTLRPRGGSSPHTRGTPALVASASALPWDHPRIRGEHFNANLTSWNGKGIIPAYAGNTVQSIANAARSAGSSPHTRGTHVMRLAGPPITRDHPRIRGEHERCAPALRRHVRIIPAYAGNTSLPAPGGRLFSGSSPHTRGTLIKFNKVLASCGDHPRIRGEHRISPFLCGHARGIIPAYAGNTVVDVDAELDHVGSSPHTRGTPSTPP